MMRIKTAYRHFRKISLFIVIVLLLFSGCSISKKEMKAYVITPTQQKLYLNLSEEDVTEIKAIIDLFTSNNKETYPVTGGIPFYVEYDDLTYMISSSVISVRKNNEWKTYEAKISKEEAANYMLAIVKICQKTYPGMFFDVMDILGKVVELKTEELTVSSDAPEGAALISELYSSLYDAYQHPKDNSEITDWQIQLVLSDLAGEHLLLLNDDQVKIDKNVYFSDFSNIIQALQFLN